MTLTLLLVLRFCQICHVISCFFPSFVVDLFSLYVLFSHFRPRDVTRGNSFFQMSSYARANVRIINEKNKRQIPMKASRGLKWQSKMYKLKRSTKTRSVGKMCGFRKNSPGLSCSKDHYWTNSLLRSRLSGCHATLPCSFRGIVAWHPKRRLPMRLLGKPLSTGLLNSFWKYLFNVKWFMHWIRLSIG